jgi:acyl-CoA thioesterase I|tara:strand:- start:4488 stop:5096 length:609 start_codon:yes stop_codon:yes gene_type:complete
MSPLLRLTLPLVLLLVACAKGPGKPEGHILLPPDAVVLAIGDSITTGHRLPGDQAWPAIVARETGLSVFNRARNGATSDEVLAALEAQLDAFEPALVIATVGGNDFLRRQPLSHTEANLREMAQTVVGRGARFLVLGLAEPQRSEVHPLYAAALAGVPGAFVDRTVLPYVYGKRRLRADPIHPNAEGHQVIAERVIQWLERD